MGRLREYRRAKPAELQKANHLRIHRFCHKRARNRPRPVLQEVGHRNRIQDDREPKGKDTQHLQHRAAVLLSLLGDPVQRVGPGKCRADAQSGHVRRWGVFDNEADRHNGSIFADGPSPGFCPAQAAGSVLPLPRGRPPYPRFPAIPAVDPAGRLLQKGMDGAQPRQRTRRGTAFSSNVFCTPQNVRLLPRAGTVVGIRYRHVSTKHPDHAERTRLSCLRLSAWASG